MKKYLLPVILIFVFSCKTIDQNIKARTSLSKCKYDIEKVEFDKLIISDDIVVDGNSIKDIKSAAINILTNFLPKIIAKNFEISIDKAFFNLYLSIENTTKDEVVLDHFDAIVSLNNNKVLEFKHNVFKRIKPGEKSIEKINFELPFDSIKLKKPEKIGFTVTFYMNIIIGSITLKDIFKITISKEFNVPYDEINKIIDSAKDKIINTVKDRVEKELDKNIYNKIKNLGK